MDITDLFGIVLYFREYLDMVAEEINDELQKRGQVLLPNLISQYNLPADFIMEVCSTITTVYR